MRPTLLVLLTLWANLVSAQPAPTPSSTPPLAPASGGAPGDTVVEVDKGDTKAAATGAEAATGDEAYKLKVQELESRVNELKEKVFRSKTRLAILKETVLATSIAGAEAQIIHRNEMGSSFKLEKISYSIDGSELFTRVDTDGDLDGQEEIEVFNGPIVPGNHTVSVFMVYRGNGYGIFSYLKGYAFRLRSSHTFRAEEGKLSRLKVVGYEKSGITTDLKDRPGIRFDAQILDSKRVPPAASAAKAGEESK